MSSTFDNRFLSTNRGVVYNRRRSKLEALKKGCVIFLLTVFFFAFFYWIAPFCTTGDTEHYRALYSSIRDESTWADRFRLERNFLGASEPIYAVLTYWSSSFLSFELFTTLANTLLTFLLSVFFFKHVKLTPANVLYVVVLLMSYYSVVLFTSAERLKVAMIFVILFYLVDHKWQKVLFGLLAVLSHIQVSLLLLPEIISLVNNEMNSRSRRFWIVVVVLSIGLFLWGLLSDYIMTKFASYNFGTINIESFIKTLVFMVLTYWLVKKERRSILLAFIPLLLASLLMGGNRIAIIGFMLLVGYHVVALKRMSGPCWLVTLYFLLQTPTFISNILTYGNGYVSSF